MLKIPVVQKVNHLINRAVETGASDIHLEPFEGVYRVRYRVDGVLHSIEDLPIIQKDEVISRIKIMADLDIAEKRRPQDGKISFSSHGKELDIRVSFLPTQFGEKAVLRLLDRASIRWDIGVLGLEREEANLLRRYIHLPYGMILVTGPTGSGKTTTLYSVLNELNSDETNITTIEDPVEYHLQGVNQTHIREDIGFTFASALRAILRQDPDIIMVGEMRDNETADIAIRAALTGHLLFSTLHTNDAPSAIIRLLHMGIEPYLISSSLRLIIAQRLVRSICPHCKVEYSPDEKILKELGLEAGIYYKGEGCERCQQTGYHGRTAVFEILPITDDLGAMILDRRSGYELRECSITSGMHPLLDVALYKVRNGYTTIDEIIKRVIYQPIRG